MRISASDFASPGIVVTDISIEEDEDFTDGKAPCCNICGAPLAHEKWDPTGYRGIRVLFVNLTISTLDSDDEPNTKPEVETVRAHSDCANDFKETLDAHKARAGKKAA